MPRAAGGRDYAICTDTCHGVGLGETITRYLLNFFSSAHPMHPRLSELLAHADHVRDEVLSFVGTLTPEQLQAPPAAGRWSVAQHLAHLHLVEQSSVRAMFRALKNARAAGLASETETSSLLGMLDHTGLAAGQGQYIAPEFVAPVDAPDLETVRSRLAESRSGLRAWAAEADGWALATVHFPHPVLGTLNLYAWVLMIADHERRHLHQMRAALAGGPAAGGAP